MAAVLWSYVGIRAAFDPNVSVQTLASLFGFAMAGGALGARLASVPRGPTAASGA